ncbi:MAG: class I SAM-dependent DNA methyltransferase [Chitinophagaceae bacterium]|nr:class I SAM-dependent DNA methyltransferase [Chitinophagaceae bacterium]
MNIKELKPKKALNKAFLKVKPNRTDIECFKANLIQLLDRTNDTESEEFHKNLVSDFLKKTYYDPAYFINTKGRKDLVIHSGKNAASPVGVIIEAKKPTNKSEMITTEKLNAKAFHELMLYYLEERITHKNLELKHLVITNINEWFIFDATLFERLFAENKNLVKQFNDFEGQRLSGIKTDFFYKQIAEPFLANLTQEIEFTYFDIRDYQNPLRNSNKSDDNKLIALFKLLSPEHLLKLPFANDSNSLDKRFYTELLHIIGLAETKEGSKKIIGRNKEGERNSGSILEDAIIQLDSLDKISRLDNPNHFGATNEERLFNIALELSITWINRILFLKLLEAQLISYHKGDESFSFLNFNKIKNFDDLNSLFFQVLARRYEERNADVKQAFQKVPYLNSSLFEPTEIEQQTLFISNLKDDKTLPVLPSTVLKNEQGKKRTGHLTTLKYLFEFLNAYDFSSEGSEEIQEDNKTLINASVLGLIFEKINGYKEGSFFTPGFITMYMCHETIGKGVIQKFGEYCLNHDLQDSRIERMEDIYDLVPKSISRPKANEIINSIKICDPAVGSGHFLVSALNEMIAVKSYLKILEDKTGKSLNRYEIQVVNDELIITDEDGDFFEYHPNNPESQRVQKTLFHEKQTIIENCLFGVDINPNSVKICRLRLWIELLKNAFYKNATELETLPNIDINIKCGNSLVSRFAIDADLSQALKKSKWTIDSYRIAVDTYRNAENKEQKREMERLIRDIKNDFRSEISLNDPKIKKLRKLSGELFTLTNQTQLFEKSQKEKAAWNKQVQKLTSETKKLEAEIEEIKSNKIYENAFEWRFEFPEVLDDEGKFVGFDVVIGNPPYIQLQKLGEESDSLEKQNFETFTKSGDIYQLFYEIGVNLLNNNGYLCFITSNKWMRTDYGKITRGYLGSKYNVQSIVDFGMGQMFDSATTYTCILLLAKQIPSSTILLCRIKNDYKLQIPLEEYVLNNLIEVENPHANSWVAYDKNQYNIIKKVEAQGIPLKDWNIEINYGIKTGFNQAFIIDTETRDRLIKADPKSAEIIKPILRGEDVKAYVPEWNNKWLINSHNGLKSKGIPAINVEKDYKAIYEWLSQFQSKLEKRTDKGYHWTNLRNCAYLEEFSKPKIIYPNMTKYLPFVYDKGSLYINDKGFIMTGDSLYYLTVFFNSELFRFCFKNNFPELLGESRELRKVFFEKINVKPVQDEIWYKQMLEQIIRKKKEGLPIDLLQNQVNEKIYDLYDVTQDERSLINLELHTTIY